MAKAEGQQQKTQKQRRTRRVIVSRTFPMGEFEITVKGPKDAVLQYEARHNFVQLATGDGELREAYDPTAARLDLQSVGAQMLAAMRAPAKAEPAADYVASDAGLKPTPEEVEIARQLQEQRMRQLNPVAAEIDDVTRAVGGF